MRARGRRRRTSPTHEPRRRSWEAAGAGGHPGRQLKLKNVNRRGRRERAYWQRVRGLAHPLAVDGGDLAAASEELHALVIRVARLHHLRRPDGKPSTPP